MFNDITYEDILDRMFDMLPADIDTREGSVMFNALAPIAAELQLAYIALAFAYQESFADTAGDEALERRCAERGIVRKPARAAILMAEIDATTQVGTRFFAPDTELTYVVDAEITEGSGNYRIICEQPGVDGNSYLGPIVPLDEVPGLTSAALVSIIEPGSQNEDVEVLRARYFASFSDTPYGGNIASYQQIVSALEGVGAVKVLAEPTGVGTVGILILDQNYAVPGAPKIAEIQALIDPAPKGSGAGFAPIGHAVTVAAPPTIAADVSFKVVLRDGVEVENIQSSLEGVITQYLSELRKQWSVESAVTIMRAILESRLLDIGGVRDIQNLVIAGAATGNVALAENTVPIGGSVTISV